MSHSSEHTPSPCWQALLSGAVPLIDEPPPTHAALYSQLPVPAIRDERIQRGAGHGWVAGE